MIFFLCVCHHFGAVKMIQFTTFAILSVRKVNQVGSLGVKNKKFPEITIA